jgi:hypothetical protein
MRRALFILFFLAILFGPAANGSPVHAVKRRGVVAPVAPSHKKAHIVRHTGGNTRVQARPVPRIIPRPEAADRRTKSTRQRSRKYQAVESAAASRPAKLRQASLSRRSIVIPPSPLRGSIESLTRQNEKTEADGLERIEDDDDLAARITQKMLVPVPASAALEVNGDLPENRRYCRPWTAVFLTDLAQAHAAQFHRPVEVSSAVRTVAYQKMLKHINGNAAPAEGDVASPHLTGASVDIAKKNLSPKELTWMRSWLLPLTEAGKIDVAEEFKQACFHITVYKSYAPPPPVIDVTPAQQKATPSTGMDHCSLLGLLQGCRTPDGHINFGVMLSEFINSGKALFAQGR